MHHPLSKVDINLLVAFDSLMTENGVTRAGRTLGITQAAMSNTLRRLREIFDDPLFIKKGHRMEPTARALELHQVVCQALYYAQRALAVNHFDPSKVQHTLRVGMVDYAATLLLTPLVNLLAKQAPGIRVEVVDTGGMDDALFLEQGRVDLVLSRFQWVPVKALLYRLFNINYVCIFRRGHPLIQEDSFTLDTMLAARYVHYYPRGMESTVVDETLAELGYKRQIIARLNSFATVPTLVANSDVMALVPSCTAVYLAQKMGLEWARLPVRTALLRMAIAWHPRTDRDPLNIWVREHVKQILNPDHVHPDVVVADPL
ncbi:MAG: LysR family transcriptional regulator [Magnetococcales bacterium]|nr:LysR family transcriptional regulator [Magnetococcales bacterium]